MFQFIFTAFLNGVAVWLASRYLNGVKVTDFPRAVIIGLVIAFLNATLGALLDVIPSPARFFSMGLFGLVVDALLLMLADHFLKGLTIKNFWYALALAAIVSVVNAVAHWIF
ncbi:MAG: phage holin family protein [Saprospiraceae bacterium]|nr:phage holin family protein [Saprospiraceae bacterium]